MRYDHSVTINRPIQEVWDYLAQPENSPTWNTIILEARKTSDGPMGNGSTISSKIKLLGRQFDSESEVTDWNAPNSFSMKTTKGTLQATVQGKLSQEGEGTRYELISEGELSGVMRIADPVLQPIIKRHLNTDLETLKALLENKVPAGAGSS